MGIFAVGGALGGYLLVKLGWRVHLWRKLQHRRSRKA
jgi:hypothetical protein